MRALIVTPNRADAELALGFLAENGIAASAYDGVGQMGGELPGDAGCILLAEEALADADMPGLRDLLENQPAWSDLPLVLVASHGASLAGLVERAFPNSGNVTLLERPLNPLTLVSAVQVGLRARSRQLEVRDLLEKREEALRQRDDFLAMLAHELRNPLAPMRNAVYVQKTLPIADEVLARTRDILERQIGHLSRLVDDLIDVARLERGKIALQPRRLDLNVAVTGAVEACLPTIQGRAHNARLVLEREALFVDADPVRLEQLLTNLIVNACKFTPPKGDIEVRTAREADAALVCVRDNGVGIEAGMLEAVFEPFAQGDQTLARSAGGLGVGLSIARRIAELHGGSLHAASEGGNRGALFEARFPLKPAPLPAAAPERRAARPALRRRILVVEDNADIRESLRMVLGFWGHDVLLAESGVEGLELVLSEKPDIALLDIGLPGMSGYDLARRIRTEAAGWPRPVRLFALTGYGQPSDRERSREAGFDAHLLKPVDLEVLRELLAA
ncbi:MAG TPA: ATP-binding protein [Burkholderiales bacterium]|nr:ATP-binding protein [Burkholderiales bacterium]